LETGFEASGEIEMLMLVLTWIGMVLGVTLLMLMALGPVIVELDGWLARRKQDGRRAKAATTTATTREATPQIVARAA
jgi:hypothetical protein